MALARLGEQRRKHTRGGNHDAISKEQRVGGGTQTADRRWRLANAIRNAERERDWLREAVFEDSVPALKAA